MHVVAPYMFAFRDVTEVVVTLKNQCERYMFHPEAAHGAQCVVGGISDDNGSAHFVIRKNSSCFFELALMKSLGSTPIQGFPHGAQELE